MNLWKYILGMLPFILSALMLANIGEHSMEEAVSPSFLDSVLYLFKGIRIFIPVRENKFEVPVMWMTVQVFVSMIVYHFPRDDFEKYGVQTLTRVHSKKRWWVSKYIWTVNSVIMYYVAGYLSIAVICVLRGNFSFAPNHVLNLLVNEINTQEIPLIPLCLACILIPVLTSAALSVLQMTISFWLNPIYSYIIILSYIIISVYYCKPWLMGANAMMLRNYFLAGEGLQTSVIVVADILIIVLAGILGYWHFHKLDVIPKNS